MSGYADRLRDIAGRAELRDAVLLQLVADAIDTDLPVPFLPTEDHDVEAEILDDDHETSGQGDLGVLGDAMVGAERAIRAALDAGAGTESVSVAVTVHGDGSWVDAVAAAAAPGGAHFVSADGTRWIEQESDRLRITVFGVSAPAKADQ